MSNIVSDLLGNSSNNQGGTTASSVINSPSTPTSVSSTSSAQAPSTSAAPVVEPSFSSNVPVVTPTTTSTTAQPSSTSTLLSTAPPTTVSVTASATTTRTTTSSTSSGMITVTTPTSALFTTTTQTSTIPFSSTMTSSTILSSSTNVPGAVDRSTSSTPAIVGGVVGGLGGLIVLVAIVWFCCLKGRKSDNFDFANETDDVWSPSHTTSTSNVAGGLARSRNGGSNRPVERYDDEDEPRQRDEQADYYGNTGNPRYTVEQPGMAGVGVVRRNLSATSHKGMIVDAEDSGYDGILDSMTSEGDHSEGGYGVASRIGKKASMRENHSEMTEVERFPLPTGPAAIPYHQAQQDYNYQPQAQQDYPQQYNRLAVEQQRGSGSPVPSHRSLPAGYIPGQEDDHEPRSTLRVMNEDLEEGEGEEDFYKKGESNNPYADLTSGLASASNSSLRNKSYPKN